MSSKDIRNLLGGAIILAAVVCLMLPLGYRRGGSADEIAYSAVLSEATQGNIDQVTIGDNVCPDS